jgi:hypothetical protein
VRVNVETFSGRKLSFRLSEIKFIFLSPVIQEFDSVRDQLSSEGARVSKLEVGLKTVMGGVPCWSTWICSFYDIVLDISTHTML